MHVLLYSQQLKQTRFIRSICLISQQVFPAPCQLLHLTCNRLSDIEFRLHVRYRTVF